MRSLVGISFQVDGVTSCPRGNYQSMITDPRPRTSYGDGHRTKFADYLLSTANDKAILIALGVVSVAPSWALVHTVFSYLFGAVIIALVINVVSSLLRRDRSRRRRLGGTSGPGHQVGPDGEARLPGAWETPAYLHHVHGDRSRCSVPAPGVQWRPSEMLAGRRKTRP
jgi:hypothetical protein